jgi:ribonuclease R
VDLRNLPLVTIDGEDAKDFDDAVFCEPHAKGFRLIVAIADVSYYVRRGTALDASARERGTSVYFPTRVIPMLPFALSNVLCSLQPNVDRLCFASEMIVSRTGALLESRCYTAVMRSVRRLTYDQAFAALFEKKPEALADLGGLADKLLPLLDVYRALLKARHKRGALEFDAAEAEFDFDDSGRIQRVYMYQRNEAHKLIEECMILANVAVARELELRSVGTLYRVHGKPEEKKLNLLLETLNALGVAAEFPEEVSPRDFRAITDRLGHDESRPFIESLIVRSMMQAVYQPQNIGHFGLALKHYAHFTSPIRRYPDLVVHRCLRAMLSDADPYGMRYDGGQLALAGAELTALEKRADESDRYVSAWLKCVYLRDRIGQTFEGLITTVVEFGAFVQLTAVGTDGLLHIDNLRDDEYVMEPGGRAWVGRTNKRRLSLGARVHVIVTSVNPIEGLVDLSLVTLDTPGKIGMQKSPHRQAKPRGKGRA